VKSRLKLFYAVLIILVLLVVFLLNASRLRRAVPALGKQTATSSERPHRSAVPQDVAGLTDSVAGAENASISAREVEIEKSKLATVRKVMEREQVPLNFYGHVIDENGVGVSGASVKVTYTHFDLTVPQYWFRETSSFTMQTDVQGFFTIKGLKGYGLSTDVSKDGYFASTNNFRGAEYVHPARGYEFTPDPSKPVVFRLRKKGVAEPVIQRSKYYLLPRNGSPVLIDLVTGGTNSPTPDLKVQAWTDDSHKDTQFRYDWRVRVEVINGGVVERTDEFQYAAPEQGYETSFEWLYPQSRDDWRNKAETSLFAKLRNGEMYARLEFQMTATGDHFCTIKSFLNPTGSRNLEPDPKLLFPDMESYNRYVAKQKQTSAKP
jgi:hypothetical protein